MSTTRPPVAADLIVGDIVLDDQDWRAVGSVVTITDEVVDGHRQDPYVVCTDLRGTFTFPADWPVELARFPATATRCGCFRCDGYALTGCINGKDQPT